MMGSGENKISILRAVTRMFSRRWILATFLVLTATAVMVRLGIWQLDRLEQRRDFNTRVQEQLGAETLPLEGSALQANLHGMEYRSVLVVGEYIHEEEVAIRNQVENGQWGVHLLTPLRIANNSGIILVDRGWIPAEDFQLGDWSAFEEPGEVVVQGMIRRSQDRPDYGPRRDATPVPGEDLLAWNFVNVPAIGEQLGYHLLPIYIQQAPNPSLPPLPIRSQPELELTEGPHMGYAIQWFSFAGVLLLGYPFFIRKRETASGVEEPILGRESDTTGGGMVHKYEKANQI